ncbi:hypothetical protein ACIRPK_20615 [Kitasatospora sp. NPDC101801]|uniref:hypothetical protein n=1 Tax=Kitasatospora sp. NPDC101801 TaxID=3364103 RepID=UPI00380A151B
MSVTREYTGWRLIYAYEPLGATTWGPHEVIERLSTACGRAQVYYQDPFADAVTWAAAQDGEVIRGYWRHGDAEWTGMPLPWKTVLTEADLADDPHEYESYAEDPGQVETTDVNTAAAHLSVDPSATRTAHRDPLDERPGSPARCGWCWSSCSAGATPTRPTWYTGH